MGFAGLKPTSIPGPGAGFGRTGGSLFGGGGLAAALALGTSLPGGVGGGWGRGGGGGFRALLGALEETPVGP